MRHFIFVHVDANLLLFMCERGNKYKEKLKNGGWVSKLRVRGRQSASVCIVI